MRSLSALVLLLSLAACGSQVRPQAADVSSPSPTPTATPTSEVSAQAQPSEAAAGPATPLTSAGPSAPTTAAPTPSVTASTGRRYSITARVVHVEGKRDQLCAPVAEPTATCGFGIDIVGVDFAQLQGRVQTDKAVRGRAALVVTVDKGVLHVVSQSVPPSATVDPGFRTPPCTAPKGGWPKGEDNESLDQKPVEDYKRTHPNALVAVAMLRPSKNQVVEYVLTNGDPAQVDKDLRPSYGARFCAFRSAYTRKQADAADLDPAFRYGRARGVYLRDSSRLSLSGQLEVHVGIITKTAALVAAVKKTPAGLVRLEELLVPV